jgi:hypothetical protein
MLDLLDLLSRRAFATLAVVLLVVGISAGTDVEIINIEFLKKIEIADQPLSDELVAMLAFGSSALLLLLLAAQRIRALLVQSLDLASQPLRGLYRTDIQYNPQVLREWYPDLIEPHWGKDEIIFPSEDDNESYDQGLRAAVAKLDKLVGFEKPFYEHYDDLETNLDLYIETKPFSHANDQFLISGFGKIQDRLRSQGDICECGLVIHKSNRERHHNVIDLRGVRAKWRLFTKGVAVVLEFEQLVHPMQRFRESHIYLSFLLRRRFFAAEWVLSTGVFLIKSSEDRKYYALGHTDNFVVG